MAERPYRICLIEDDAIMGEALSDRLAIEGFECDWFRQGRPALETLGRKRYDAVVSDIQLPDANGEALFAEARAGGALPPWIFITGYGAIDGAVRMLKLGAEDYLTKPLDIRALLDKLRTVCARGRPSAAGEPTLGLSGAMRAIEAMLPRIAESSGTVLITGESGVGKEEVARALHRLRDPEGRRPFIAVNCGALAENLLEAELFGHVRGAFTDAKADRVGRFELAEGGTLFLDEIANITPSLQAKLLRVLETGELERVGSSRTRRVDVRILSATNATLHDEAAAGRFRQDLLFRLNTIEIHLPPLRERREDIPLLAIHFLRRDAQRYRKDLLGFDPQALQMLLEYTWPGNVRELSHAVERAVLMAQGTHVRAGDFALRARPDSAGPRLEEMSLEEVEKLLVQKALARYDGNVSHAAKALGLSRSGLYRRLQKFGL